MMRSVMLSALVLFLSSLGMLAGRGITTCIDDTKATPTDGVTEQQTVDASLTSSTAASMQGDLARSFSAVPVSQSTVQIGDVTITASGSSSLAGTFSSNDSNDADSSRLFDDAISTDEGVSLEAAADLIRKEFPTASEDIVAGWAESFEGLSAVEVMGILQQKKLLSTSLDSALPSSLSMPLEDAEEKSVSNTTPMEAEEGNPPESPGYRQSRRLWRYGAGSEPNSTLSVTDFTPGQMIVTGFRSHAAIDDRSGLVMFRLENQTATRCGAFEVLSNRRIGVRLPSGEHPLAGLSPLPDGVEEFSMDATGTVVAQSKNGESHPLGTITCIRFLDTRALETADSLAFDFSALAAGDFEAVASPALMQGQLELSNHKN